MNNVWVIGQGGLGTAIRDLLNQEDIGVRCFSRNTNNYLDICSASSINDLIHNTTELPDAIIITSGILHDVNHFPEKTITAVEPDWLFESININVLPTLFFTQAITQQLSKHNKIIIASFSARVSSISDNRLGGWHSYRMSKCMLNMLIKNVSLEWSFKSPQSIIFGYHPGTVDTPLSKPFQKTLKKDQLFSTNTAAKHFIACLKTRTKKHSGKLYDWQQKEISP